MGVEVSERVEEPEESTGPRFAERDAASGFHGESTVVEISWSGVKMLEHGNPSTMLQGTAPDGSKKDSALVRGFGLAIEG